MPDPRTDEQLIEAYYAGDKSADSPADRGESAFDLLFNRYYTRCLGYLYHKSICKDENFLEDVRGKMGLM